MIDTLIDKQDNFEIVRDQIGGILATETVNQVQLADDAGKPKPDDWKLRIYLERSNPWEQFLNVEDKQEVDQDFSPLVNVWYDNSNFDEKSSDTSKSQTSISIFNIDCYGYGRAQADGSGHKPGDREAAYEVQKAIRLVRNILMSAEYTYLQLRGLVWVRFPQTINVFQPELSKETVGQVIGARIALMVKFNETSPQVASVELEQVFVDVERAEDGQLIVEANYDYS